MNGCKTIAICNQKGGVGKTTTALNLGVGLAKAGRRVLLIDADPQSDLTSSLGWEGDKLDNSLGSLMYQVTRDSEPAVRETILHHEEGVDLIPSNLDLSMMETQLVNAMSREKVLSNALKNVKADYDYILIDCMPSLGMITVNALTAADSVIIPVQAQYLPAKGMTQLMKSINMVRSHKRYDAKHGKPVPEGAIKCQEADPVTGHLPCWVKVSPDAPEDKWFRAARDHYEGLLTDGTYEAVGPHFQANPYRLDTDILIRHGMDIIDVPRTFEGIRGYLREHNIEGIVFWKDGEPLCKIKRSDFGFEWPEK